MRIKTRDDRRQRIKYRIRARVQGTEARPRLTVFRSVTHIYAQVVDDSTGSTIAAASTVEPSVRGAMGAEAKGGNVAGAKLIGKTIAERLLEKGVRQVVFDRNGFLYHGRVKAVADAAREAGLEF
ncbi:MAG: 50S ribosomal protein L18 [Vicinamibacterales bacterium]